MSFPWLEPSPRFEHLIVADIGFISYGITTARERGLIVHANPSFEKGGLEVSAITPDNLGETKLLLKYYGEGEYIIAWSVSSQAKQGDGFWVKTTEEFDFIGSSPRIRTDSTILIPNHREQPEIQIHYTAVIKPNLGGMTTGQIIKVKIGENDLVTIDPSAFPVYDHDAADDITRMENVLKLPSLNDIERELILSDKRTKIKYQCFQTEDSVILSINCCGYMLHLVLPTPLVEDLLKKETPVSIPSSLFNGVIPIILGATVERFDYQGQN